jgi:hypothetical protein
MSFGLTTARLNASSVESTYIMPGVPNSRNDVLSAVTASLQPENTCAWGENISKILSTNAWRVVIFGR